MYSGYFTKEMRLRWAFRYALSLNWRLVITFSSLSIVEIEWCTIRFCSITCDMSRRRSLGSRRKLLCEIIELSRESHAKLDMLLRPVG